jgi:hypothetical protein
MWVKLRSPEAQPGGLLCPEEQTCSETIGMSQTCQKQTHALQQAGLFDHLVGSQQYGGGHRSNVDGSASGAPQDVAGTTARDPVPAKSCPSYRQR